MSSLPRPTGDSVATTKQSADDSRTRALRETGATQLINKRKALLELHEQLEEEKVEEFVAREDALRRKDAELEDSIVRFSRYLQENDAKRARALRRAADEKALCAEKAAEGQQLAEEAKRLKAELAEAQEVVRRNLRSQEYLEAVVERRDTFQEIGDVIRRHTALAGTNADLRQRQWEAAQETDRIRAETQAHAEARIEEILATRAQIPVLQQQANTLQAEAALLEAACLQAQQRAHQEALERCQVLLAARNAFQRCLRASRLPHHSQADLAGQLRLVGNFVADLQWVLAENGVPCGGGAA